MALVNISEAAKLAQISRVTMYKKYINTGNLSVTSDERGKPAIDTSELLRVFGAIYTEKQSDSVQIVQGVSPRFTHKTGTLTAEIEHLKTIIERQERELHDSKEEIAWLRQRIEATEQRHLAGPTTTRKWWWPW